MTEGDRSAMKSALNRLSGSHLLVLGDLMVDHYIWGEVDRISPEAPVPVVDARDETLRLGGAGNVINNLLALGCRVTAVGTVGEDEDGRWLRDRLGEKGVDARGVLTHPGRKTGRKTRVMTSHQQVLRIDRETRGPISNTMENRLLDFIDENAGVFQAILISDYLKGLLTETFLRRAIAFGRRKGLPVIVDPKGPDFEKYRGASLLTPNRNEVQAVVGKSLRDREAVVDAGERLCRDLELENLVITLGEDGMMLFMGGPDEISTLHLPTEVREVYDVTGAGDTVTALLGAARAGGIDLETAARLANLAAGIVVGKLGTSVADIHEIQIAAEETAQGGEPKIKDLHGIQKLVERGRKDGKKVVFTNGCFDILHAGHLKLLRIARSMGDLLVLGLNSDCSVRRIKGPRRPVIGQEERAHLLAALDCVDFVVIFEEDTPEKLIEALRPDVLVKGGDYTPDLVVGRDLVQSYGGKVEIVQQLEGRSTTALIEDILASAGE